jgi:hypothetical protein
MLRPKVEEILNEFRDDSNAHFFLFLEGYISAFWDHNLEIRIGSKGLVRHIPGVRWDGSRPAQSGTTAPTTVGMTNPVFQALPCSLSPLPHVHIPACV